MKAHILIPQILQMIAWPVAHFIFRINGTFVVHGRENLKQLGGAVIFASNHANELDPVIQRAILPMVSKHTPLFWVARKKDEYQWKGWRKFVYGDWFFKSWGAWPAYKGYQDYEKSLRHHINLLKGGNAVGVFPQGTMGVKDKLSEEDLRKVPARGGVIFLSEHTQAPIVPVTIKGVRGINVSKLFFQKTHIEIFIHPPVYIRKGITDYREEAARLMEIIYSV